MRRLASAIALALFAAACSKSPCQELGEKLCACTGLGTDACRTQVEQQIKSTDVNQDKCEALLGTCNAPANAQFCEWLLTRCGKASCGISNDPVADPEVCPTVI